MAENLANFVKNGTENLFKNISGNQLRWIDQHPKNINIAIDSALNSTNSGRLVEGKVADFLRNKVDIKGFGVEVKRVANNTKATDIDILTNNNIVEIKKSIGAVSETQLDRLVTNSHPDFFNYDFKKVVLYVDEAIDMSNVNNVNLLNRLKDKGVTIVNSLDELGGILN